MLNQTHWRARANCYECSTEMLVIYPIPEDRKIGLHDCDTCGQPMSWTSADTSEFGMLIWRELSNSLRFFKSIEPIVEITLKSKGK